MGRYLDIGGTRYLLEQLHDIMEKMLVGDIDFSDYVTKTELQKILDELNIDIDLSNYVTKEELEDALADIDTSNIDLSAYATKEYVTDAINNAELGGDGSSVDLSIYAKKTDLDAKADTEHTHTMSDITDYTAPDLSSYAKKTDIPSLDGYALKTEIPSTDGLATTEYVDNAVANVPTGGDVDLSNYYTKTEVDTAISNVDVKADLSDYQYEPQNYKYEYLDIYGTKLGIEMPQLPTFDGGTVLHITPPDGWSNFINAENDCMTVYVKKDKDREYIDVMNDDIIYNVDSEGNATPTLTIPNTTAGFIDNYIIRGTQYVPNGGVVSFKSKQSGWLYDYQTIDSSIGLSCYTKWTTNFGSFASGIEGFKLTFDTSKRTGSVTFGFKYPEDGYEWYINRPSGGIIKKGSSVTVDVTDVDTYSIYVPVGSDDNFHVTCPEYTITYPDEIASGTFKIWTSDIDVVNISTQYEFTVNVKQFTDERYVRYGNEDLVKSIKPIIPTRASELLNDVPFATETYVNEKVTEISGVDLSNYYTKSETDALVENVNIDVAVAGVDEPDATPSTWYSTADKSYSAVVKTAKYAKYRFTVTNPDGTTKVLYTSIARGADGINGTNGVDGEDGTDGITPHIDETTKHWFIGETDTGVLAEGINGVDGKDGTNGVDGTNGQDGADGYTPVRGTDYWTEQDIQTIKDYIDTELGVIENGSY